MFEAPSLPSLTTLIPLPFLFCLLGSFLFTLTVFKKLFFVCVCVCVITVLTGVIDSFKDPRQWI